MVPLHRQQDHKVVEVKPSTHIMNMKSTKKGGTRQGGPREVPLHYESAVRQGQLYVSHKHIRKVHNNTHHALRYAEKIAGPSTQELGFPQPKKLG